jgi:hypothetical protein
MTKAELNAVAERIRLAISDRVEARDSVHPFATEDEFWSEYGAAFEKELRLLGDYDDELIARMVARYVAGMKVYVKRRIEREAH